MWGKQVPASLAGDTPSPYMVGQLSDWLRPVHGADCLHLALVLCYMWNLVGIVFYVVAWQFHGRWGKPRLMYGLIP